MRVSGWNDERLGIFVAADGTPLPSKRRNFTAYTTLASQRLLSLRLRGGIRCVFAQKGGTYAKIWESTEPLNLVLGL